jgi:hypothetical protein
MIVFYSLGYKLDVREKRFLKTGTISIKTFPENAQLLVNNSKEDKLTPCVLTELMPRIYDIVLEKEGFLSVSIISGGKALRGRNDRCRPGSEDRGNAEGSFSV